VSCRTSGWTACRDLAAEENDKDLDEIVDNVAVLRAVGASAWSEETPVTG
jgi:hypothetical protein